MDIVPPGFTNKAASAIDAETLREYLNKLDYLLYCYSDSARGCFDQSFEPMLLYCRKLMLEKMKELIIKELM